MKWSSARGIAQLPDFPRAQVRAEEIGHSKKVLKLTCNGVGLDKKDLFGKSDPYLELARENPDGSYTKVRKTNVRASLRVASVCVAPAKCNLPPLSPLKSFLQPCLVFHQSSIKLYMCADT